MKNIIDKKNTIDENVQGIFIAEEGVDWNGVMIYKNSLVTIDNNYIYINETPLNYFSLLDNQYGEKLKDYKKGDSYLFDHTEDCTFNSLCKDEKITIKNGVLSRWNKDHFCYSRRSKSEDLDKIPTFKYKDRVYSSLGYQINIVSKEIEGGFYMRGDKYFEMVGEAMEDIFVK